MKKRAPPGEANCVVVRHTASDGSKGLHLRAIATMAPGTQLTITSVALCANVLDEFVRALLPQLDLTSGGPARGLHAPPGPNGPLQGRHVPPALLPPHRPLTYPACRFLLSPSAHKEFAVDLPELAH